jgi:acyl-CoA thioester hydrolase
MYIKEFEIRWSDLDANRHLANSAYINFMSHTRMSFLTEMDLSHRHLEEFGLGPVVFYEHIYYFREVFPGAPIRVSLQLAGLAEDGRFFEFHHDFYDQKGIHMAHCEMLGAWIDLKSRKLTALPEELQQKFDQMERPTGFRVLSREDTRKYAKQPKDLV